MLLKWKFALNLCVFTIQHTWPIYVYTIGIRKSPSNTHTYRGLATADAIALEHERVRCVQTFAVVASERRADLVTFDGSLPREIFARSLSFAQTHLDSTVGFPYSSPSLMAERWFTYMRYVSCRARMCVHCVVMHITSSPYYRISPKQARMQTFLCNPSRGGHWFKSTFRRIDKCSLVAVRRFTQCTAIIRILS